MSATLSVPQTLADSVRALAADEALPLTVVTHDDADVRVVQSPQRRQSTVTVLEAGGWIACGTAMQVAQTLDLRPRQLGKLLDRLDVRIRACQLGCFE